jgi:NAD(P)-dependent dehydrogenase (short-subunit alcohol dehydrogenase family)
MSPTQTKSILITGCSSEGIGAAMALVLARRGHHVFATARDTTKVPDALSSLANVTVLPLDVVDTASVAAAARAVADSGLGLHVLVNNAGGGYVRPVLDIDIAAAQRLHDINLWGPLRTVQAFADLLIASHGRVVNVSSSASVLNSPWMGK